MTVAISELPASASMASHGAQDSSSATSLAALTPAERSLVEQLRHEVASIVQAHADLIAFCNDHTYVRYLRARQWNLVKATKMLKHTLEWRLEFKPHLITWEEIAPEAETGKTYLYHVQDKRGRPIVFMRPRNENTKESPRQIRHLVYTLEHASRLSDQYGVGKMCWLLDFGGYSMSNAPPLRVSMHCNSILANHYPERLGQAVCFHAPTLFSLTWRAVQPFIDPVTKQKIVFVDKGHKEVEMMDSRFHMDQLERCMGGSLPDNHYDHAKQGARRRALDEEVAKDLRAIEERLQHHNHNGAEQHGSKQHGGAQEHQQAVEGLVQAAGQMTVVAAN